MSLLHRLKDACERSWPVASLRTYLFAVMLLATLPMAALMGLHIFSELRSEQARVEGELGRSAAAFAQSVQRQLASSIDGLGVLAQSELFQQGRVAALGRLLHGRPRPDWDSVFLLDRDGSVVLDTAAHRATPTELGELRALQQRVLRDRRAAVSGLSEAQAPGSRAVSVALPVLQNGALRYVLGARMGEAVWQHLAAIAAKPAGGHAALFDAQDRLIGTSVAAVAPPGALLPRDAAQAMQGQAAGVEGSSDVDGQAVYAGWETVPMSGWRAWVALPAAPIDAAYRRALGAAVATSGASLLLGLLLAAVVARRIDRPLRQLARDGGAALPGHVAVREIAALRDALQRAQADDHAARRTLHGDAQKDEFLTMLGHELRNPLGAISAAADVLESAPADSEIAAEARAIIGRQSRTLAHVMNDLLDVGRVMAGKIVLACEPVNLAAVVRRVDATLTLTGAASERPLRFQLQDAWVDGDAVRLEQIVMNLLTNAIKYTAQGRPIVVRVASDNDCAVLEVRDAGAGIAPALLPHVFDLFTQGERPLDRRAEGLGMGLTLVRRLVELHGGSVSVDSSGAGSRFTVRLPSAAPAQPVADDTLPRSRRRHVLVVEDNHDVLAALRAKLELDGHTVSTATDGAEGLDRLLALRPEVSIVDIGLPGLTGYELAQHARAAGYAGRMIAISGYGAQREVRAALVAGFDAHLVKPVDRDRLRASLSAD